MTDRTGWILALVVAGAFLPAARAQDAEPAALLLRAQLLYGAEEFVSSPQPWSNGVGTAPLHVVDTPPAPPPRDPWLGRDKVQHLVFSGLWTLGTQYALVNKAAWSERRALPLSAGTAGLIGLSKELYDWRHSPSRFFSTRDLVADAAGIALAVGFILL